MKKYRVFPIAILLVLFSIGLAQAATYQFDTGISYLEHGRYYIWGTNWTIPDGETIGGASLFFEDISNHDCGTNDLYIQLLPEANAGVFEGSDNPSAGNYFLSLSNPGIELAHWENLPDTPQNKIYDFKPNEVDMLIQYVADGNFGLGFDPDCLYQPKITLTMETKAVPLPGAFFLLLSGLIGLIGTRRKLFRIIFSGQARIHLLF